MKLLMISGDQRVLTGEQGPFIKTLELLRQHWEHIDVICPKPSTLATQYHLNHEGGYDVFSNVTLYPSPWSKIWFWLWVRRQTRLRCATTQYVCATVQTYFPPLAYWGASRALRHKKVPVCAEIHGDPLSLVRAWPAMCFFGRWILTLSLSSCQMIRVVSDQLRTMLISWSVAPEKIHLVPAIYLDLQAFKPVQTPAPIYDACFCGRLAAGKGCDIFIEAISRLPQARALIIGDGPLRASLADQVQKSGLRDRVTFTGWVSQPESLATYLRQAKCFVLASEHEGGPRVAFEAMACGLPVISTKVGLLAEVMTNEREGLWFDGSVTHLTKQLSRLLENDLLRSHLSEAAVMRARDFDRLAAIKRYATFLQRV